jgi:hypothetical protein
MSLEHRFPRGTEHELPIRSIFGAPKRRLLKVLLGLLVVGGAFSAQQTHARESFLMTAIAQPEAGKLSSVSVPRSEAPGADGVGLFGVGIPDRNNANKLERCQLAWILIRSVSNGTHRSDSATA